MTVSGLYLSPPHVFPPLHLIPRRASLSSPLESIPRCVFVCVCVCACVRVCVRARIHATSIASLPPPLT